MRFPGFSAFALAAVAVVLGVTLAGCGGSSPTSPASPPASSVVADSRGCYAGLPNPQLQWTAEGLLSVANWRSYPEALFAPSPELAPCGANRNSSRTWVEIYDAKGVRDYGYCAITRPDELARLHTIGLDRSRGAYIVMMDRRCGTNYYSNIAS